MAMPTKRVMAVATKAAGDKEGDSEGGKSDGGGNKEGDGEEEGEGPHLSSSSDCLPPRHMLPLLLRLVTAFRAVVGAAPGHSFGISSAAASFQTSDSHISNKCLSHARSIYRIYRMRYLHLLHLSHVIAFIACDIELVASIA